MTDWNLLIKELVKFREERDWQQFHNSKDLALAFSIEASELNELGLRKKAEEADPAFRNFSINFKPRLLCAHFVLRI